MGRFSMAGWARVHVPSHGVLVEGEGLVKCTKLDGAYHLDDPVFIRNQSEVKERHSIVALE